MSDKVRPEARVVKRPAAQGDPERSVDERASDHGAIAGSIDELLPALIAKLGATGLAELEIRENGLRIRLRRPADGSVAHDGRAGDRGLRGDRSRTAPSTGGAPSVTGLTPVGPGRERREGREVQTGGPSHDPARFEDLRAVATSPAVGIFQPRAEARAGTRVRAGDRLGTVDMLGVPQEVVAPTDGLVGASLVEAGDAVEYGQELLVIEFASVSSGTPAGPTSTGSTPVPPTPLDH